MSPSWWVSKKARDLMLLVFLVGTFQVDAQRFVLLNSFGNLLVLRVVLVADSALPKTNVAWCDVKTD